MHRFMFAFMLFVGSALFTYTAEAQSNGDAPTTTEESTPKAEELPPGFQPVKGAPNVAQIDPNPLVVGAYATFFFGIFGYVIFLARRQAEMAKEMEELAAQIQKVDRA